MEIQREDFVTNGSKGISILNLSDLKDESNSTVIKKSGKRIL